MAEAVKKLQDDLDEDGSDWDAMGITFGKVRSRQGRRHYTVQARLLENGNDNGSRNGNGAGAARKIRSRAAAPPCGSGERRVSRCRKCSCTGP